MLARLRPTPAGQTYLLGRGRHALLHHNEGTRDVLLLHALTVHLDGLDADLGLLCRQITGWSVLRGPFPLGTQVLTWLCQGTAVPLPLSGLSLPVCKARTRQLVPRMGGMAASRSHGS